MLWCSRIGITLALATLRVVGREGRTHFPLFKVTLMLFWTQYSWGQNGVWKGLFLYLEVSRFPPFIWLFKNNISHLINSSLCHSHFNGGYGQSSLKAILRNHHKEQTRKTSFKNVLCLCLPSQKPPSPHPSLSLQFHRPPFGFLY